MHKQVMEFCRQQLTKKDISRKRILEAGSYNVNGSVREDILKLQPYQYIGVDIRMGKDVDEVCDANDLVKRFGRDSFDVVISTEMLEHVEDWRAAIHNMKQVTKPGGIILLTTRSKRFHVHDYPSDYWRYEEQDILKIFSDCKILVLEKDAPNDGVLVKIAKPKNFIENDLANIQLFSIIDYLIEKSRPFFGYVKHNLTEPLIGAEIGVGEGTHSLYVSQLLNFKEYHLVDFWQPYLEGDKIENRYCACYERVKNMFANKSNCFIHKQESSQTAKEFPDGYFDFVYIDADNNYKSEKQHIESWLPKVKSGGIIGGHNYSAKWQEVIDAVNDCFQKLKVAGKKLELNVEQSDWWVKLEV